MCPLTFSKFLLEPEWAMISAILQFTTQINSEYSTGEQNMREFPYHSFDLFDRIRI